MKLSREQLEELINDLFAEGYFVAERKLSEICEMLSRRGVTAIAQKKANIFSKLNGMVTSKKLYKVKKSDGYVFVQR